MTLSTVLECHGDEHSTGDLTRWVKCCACEPLRQRAARGWGTTHAQKAPNTSPATRASHWACHESLPRSRLDSSRPGFSPPLHHLHTSLPPARQQTESPARTLDAREARAAACEGGPGVPAGGHARRRLAASVVQAAGAVPRAEVALERCTLQSGSTL